MSNSFKVVCLAGGVGGAKLAEGLAQIMPPEQLSIIVNTGDDFEHGGLHISPDLDTVMYTLAGVANSETGWGREGETWNMMETLSTMNGPDWFKLGDRDLATHLTRTFILRTGATLSQVTRHFRVALKFKPTLIPMSDGVVPTQIETEEGEILAFQDWFVRKLWKPVVKNVVLPENGRLSPPAAQALQNADIVLIAPSNPFVSIDPILNMYPARAMIEDLPRAVVAVSPIIGGQAVKGPLGKMMTDWGMEVSATAVANHYGDLIDGFVYDSADQKPFTAQMPSLAANTLMKNSEDRAAVAQQVLDFAISLTEK